MHVTRPIDKKDMAEPTRKKPRKLNFSEAELMTLVEEVKKREHVVMAKFDTKVTTQTKAFAHALTKNI